MVLVSINVGEKDLEYLKKVVAIKYNGVNRKFSHFMVESAKECAKEILDIKEFSYEETQLTKHEESQFDKEVK